MAIFLQDGKYRIEKSLGQGGFGITYLATQVNLNRQVAIEEFYPKDFCDTSQVRLTPKPGDEELVARFKRKFISEARNVAKLDHPNIVKIYDVFEENSTAYFVMEYVEGESLDAMAKRGAMSEADALHYIIPIARALEYVHSEIMTHLDVKPANIMVRRKNNTPVLIDFGLAKQYDRTTGGETSTSFVGLSPGYAPIEQYNQGGVNTFSPQIDVYALGATLYRLVTGTTPPEPTMRESQDIKVAAQISAGTRNAIQHAMRMFKSNRTPSMTAFIAELSATPTPQTIPQPQPVTQSIEVNAPHKWKSKLRNFLIRAISALAIIGVAILGIDIFDYLMMVIRANNGDVEYQMSLGNYYHRGGGILGEILHDKYAAIKWYRKAAEQGYARAQCKLGHSYRLGEGVGQDYAMAVEWYRKAAEQGYVPAQNGLGICYDNGFGVEQDYAKAVEWYRKAVVQGYAPAQDNLGTCYECGRGVKQDYAKAVEWYRKAAEQGYARAQYNLGDCYENGRGVEKNRYKAVEWYQQAAARGNENAKRRLSDMGV